VYENIHEDHINISRFANHLPNILLTCSFDNTVKLWDNRSASLCCLLFAVYCLLVCYRLFAVCCLLFAVCCLLSAVCCLLSAVCCLLSAVCCLLSAVCCLLSWSVALVAFVSVSRLFDDLSIGLPAYLVMNSSAPAHQPANLSACLATFLTFCSFISMYQLGLSMSGSITCSLSTAYTLTPAMSW
jgi:hypothetical protein